MSEATPETPAVEAPADPAPVADEQNVADLPQWARDAITKANKEAATYRTKVKELEPKAQMAERLEEASKTELQRLQEAHEQARRDADTSRADAIRFRAAAKHGISEEDFDLLGTGDEDQIEARAQRIAALRAASAPTPPPAGRSKEQLRPGATPGEPLSAEDADYQALFGQGAS